MQLVLPVLHAHDYRFSNFLLGQNAAVVAHIKNTLQTVVHSGSAITYIYGSAGAGKSHLLLASHQLAEAQSLNCQYIDLRELKMMPPEIIGGIGKIDALFIDNIDTIADNEAWQIQLFDTINQFLESSGQCMLIAANQSVAGCEFTLPDLASRLTWGTTFHLYELNEAEKVLALQRHFSERGIVVQEEVIEFLMKRSQRDMHKLMSLVTQLDLSSLQSKRKLTIPFVKQVLKI